MKQLLAATAVIAALVTPVAWFFGRDPQPVIQVAAKPVVETSLGLISEEARQRIVTQAERRQEEQADAMLDDMHKIASGLRGLASDETGPPLVVGEVAATEVTGGVAADLGLRPDPLQGKRHHSRDWPSRPQAPMSAGCTAHTGAHQRPLAAIPVPRAPFFPMPVCRLAFAWRAVPTVSPAS